VLFIRRALGECGVVHYKFIRNGVSAFALSVGVLCSILAIGSCTNIATERTSILDVTALNFSETIQEEHTRRKSRLQSLSVKSLTAAPKYYEYLIRKDEIPGSPSDIPVLRVVFEERVFFDTALWNIRPDAESILDVISESLRTEPPDVALFVAGHTDSRGSDSYNLNLSVKRANSVAEALVKRGVGNARIWRVGFGKAVPLRANDSEANMAINRRVEFILAGKFEAVAVWLSKQPEFLCSDKTNIPELCKNPSATKGTFPAIPVQPQVTPSPSNPGHPTATGLSIQNHKPVEIILQKPSITETGRPNR
jgi:outer membrane protein OmpA-like peptidoglycan-associated protein